MTPERMTTYVKHGDAIVRVEPAERVHGILCRSFDGEYFFRVYNADRSSFTDYDLHHDDLSITIDADAMASFYHRGDHHWLDHSPEVLGTPQVTADGLPMNDGTAVE